MNRIWMMPGADTVGSPRAPSFILTSTATPRALCPDLLSIRDIGEADGWRGRVVRGVFRVLKWVTGV